MAGVGVPVAYSLPAASPTPAGAAFSGKPPGKLAETNEINAYTSDRPG